jgi:hypothetical protein
MADTVVLFPLASRTAKVRDVATKMIAKATDRHAVYYREQVNDALRLQLERRGVSADDCARELTAFWEAVRCEILAQVYRRRYPGDDAA